MTDDAAYRRCVAALWALVGTVDADGLLAPVAEAAANALAAARGCDSFLLLQERDGLLFVNGRRIQLGIEAFHAVQGLVAAMKSRGVGEVLFDGGVDAAALGAWAGCWRRTAATADPEADLVAAGARGVHANRREGLPAVPGPLPEDRPLAAGDSLRATFVQHRLAAALPKDGLVSPRQGKVVVEAVVERLLALPGGIEPLRLLEEDPALLQRALAVTTTTAVLARLAGRNEAAAADLGAAALLAHLGERLDPERPGAAAFGWLLGRGPEALWRRAAALALARREPTGELPGAALDDLALMQTAELLLGAGEPVAAVRAAVVNGDLPAACAQLADEALRVLAG